MTGSEAHLDSNPFVGPRPFEPGERLYGRDKEIRKLDLLRSGGVISEKDYQTRRSVLEKKRKD